MAWSAWGCVIYGAENARLLLPPLCVSGLVGVFLIKEIIL